jgi:hypothetical protein
MTRSAFSSVDVEEPARPIDVRVVRQWAIWLVAGIAALYVAIGLVRAYLVVTEDNPGFKRCTALDFWWYEPAAWLCGVK